MRPSNDRGGTHSEWLLEDASVELRVGLRLLRCTRTKTVIFYWGRC